ncbi:MAG TPA: hypothetical protein VLR46_04180 [Candidatus Dormibacteraeota bacterium]|nr:hypothetical protein [Candidatus Dormibacteraeota bacterium]
MLAYVFSHRPGGGVDVTDYESALKHFHAMLAGAPPAGFLGSSTFRVGDRYSDWYLVESSAALDALNEAAVSGARSSAHDAAARMAVDGMGKLWSLAGGEPPRGGGYEIPFSKPTGTSYADLYERVQPFAALPGVSLWRRMMVLGPPPEFCLIGPAAIELPREFRPEVLRREPI